MHAFPLAPLTLSVKPKEHLALVGTSGAGKTSLLAGISRLLAVGGGKLILDGWEARSVALGRWRGALLCLPQQPLLLAGSVRHNLDPEGIESDASLWEALRLVGLDSRVRLREAGIARDSVGVGRVLAQLGGDTKRVTSRERGEICWGWGVTSSRAFTITIARLQLSGGQRRLLVLARLLLRRRSAHLVLLDEPFAGMEQSEVTPLHSMLKQQLAHAALMAVTHRLLPILHFFSRILVFEKGCCVQDASPAELLAVEGHVQQLFLQAPSRLQSHVERMMALRRSEGLHAVQTLLQSVNSTGQSESEPPLT
ncbi:unnamed protein product [Effrenium voratum]|nr:unnamed protein product [Effrenium voratum]